ncbi:MAG: pentapeptide repeat-containing protein, partial [Pirellulales bacterium]|nr:pentapeptide repeat-containing protein [Pirellulales bacterium]
PSHLPTNWSLINGYLIGPWANLTGADLTNAILTNANLDYAQLHVAILAGANLTNTNLTNAMLGDANLLGVTGAAKYNSLTILPASFDPVAAGWTLVS